MYVICFHIHLSHRQRNKLKSGMAQPGATGIARNTVNPQINAGPRLNAGGLGRINAGRVYSRIYDR
jgi:hypothetical protein